MRGLLLAIKHLFYSVMVMSGALLLTACSSTEDTSKNINFGYTSGSIDNSANDVNVKVSDVKRIRNVFERLKPAALQLAKESGNSEEFSPTLLIVNNKALNAWTSSKENITFYTGLVTRLNLNDDEIAAILSHEMAHIILAHRKQAENYKANSDALVSVGAIALNLAAGFDLNDVLTETEEATTGRAFSRKLEEEADKTGLILMAQSGYDPQATIALWTKLDSVNPEEKQGLDELFSTHPSSGTRMVLLNKLMPVAENIYIEAKNTEKRKRDRS